MEIEQLRRHLVALQTRIKCQRREIENLTKILHGARRVAASRVAPEWAEIGVEVLDGFGDPYTIRCFGDSGFFDSANAKHYWSSGYKPKAACEKSVKESLGWEE